MKRKGFEQMKITPYLSFNGNAAEAIALYEKAFGVKAQVMKYSDAPPSEGYNPPAGTENHVMHACLTNREDYTVYICDVPPSDPVAFGSGNSIHIAFDSEDKVKSAFAVLKEGGEVTMELQQTFWNKLFGSLVDKFGVCWMISMVDGN
jgi:PhnB protein